MSARFSHLPMAMALPAAILALLALMVIPIPTILLDVFFVLNIALAIAILMVALNSRKPLDFSSFPTVLLFATLLRLALNVASTRIVLINGHEGGAAAGQVIESFGAFLVGGNFAVGLFVFIILMIINMIVITKGAGRVSEVSARFVLDALPGKQMAIDADIAAGLVTSEDARKRREEVTVEAEFYGSMDGASKFVKGDAIAALLILGVNLIAGFALGMASHGLSAAEAAEMYITLAVGDALVAQVPALLLSIAAAAIVTRVADKRDLVGQISGQFSDARGWLPVALVLGAIALVPAMPQMIFAPAAGIAFIIYRRLKSRAEQVQTVAEPVELPAPEAISVEDVSDQTLVTLELGYGLVHLVSEDQGSPLVARTTGIRKQLSRQFGFVLPQFRIRDCIDMAPNAYRLNLAGVTLGQHEIRPQKMLAIDLGEASEQHGISGESTRDPSFGCPAIWIAREDRDRATAEGFLVVDADTVIATHVNQILADRGEQLLGPEEVRALLDTAAEQSPGLVEAIYPEPLSLAAVTRIFRALIADGITLANLPPLLTSLALGLQQTSDFNDLVDHVRIDMGGWIVGRICPPGETLKVATLEAPLEGALLGGVIDPATGQPVIDPGCAKVIATELARLVEQEHASIALIVQPPLRRALTVCLKSRVPQAVVLSINELPATQAVEVLSIIGQHDEEAQTLPEPAPNNANVEALAA